MKPYEKTFRNSFGGIFDLALRFLFFSFPTAFVFFSPTEIYFRVFVGVIWIALAFAVVRFLFFFTKWIKVTDEEIIIQSLIGKKSLRWTEVEHVSVQGEYLRLHGRDGSAILSIGSQMNGYAELLDLLFKNHSKLFKTLESEFISLWKYSELFALLFVLFLLGVGAYSFLESDWFLGILLFGLGTFALFSWPKAPRIVTWLDDKIIVTYPFRETFYSARWIDSITLGETRSWGQVSHFVKINPKMGNSISLSAFPHNGLLAYRSLQHWHKRELEKATIPSF